MIRSSLFYIVGLLISFSVQAKTDVEVKEAVLAELMDRHPATGAEWWKALGPNTPKVLISMYETDSSTYHRMRLLEGLGAFAEDTRATEFIKQQARSTPDDVIRNVALKALGSQGSKEEDFVAGFLTHNDPHTRVYAADALKRIGTLTAQSRVDQFLNGEKTPWVVAQVKGEPVPMATSVLKPSGSSEDRLSGEMNGDWRGFWVALPGAGVKGRLKAESASLKLAVVNVNALTGSLTLKSGNKIRTLTLARAGGKGIHLSGAFTEDMAGPSSGPGKAPTVVRVETPFEGEIVKLGENWLLQVKMPSWGGVLQLVKESSAQ